MTPAELDALIDATPGAAMVLLVEGDWRAIMGDRATAAMRREQGVQPAYHGLPVWVVSPGPSRMLTGEQVQREGLGVLPPVDGR